VRFALHDPTSEAVAVLMVWTNHLGYLEPTKH
jgi:hypothetical protein